MKKRFRIAGICPAYFELEKQGKEFMLKASRPYLCLQIQIRDDLIVSIPFRSHLNHDYGFRTYQKRGLDYTKVVLIDSIYLIDLGKAIYYKDYITIRNNIEKIEQDVLSFFDKYKELLKQTELTQDEQLILRYTTLQYFHKELELHDSELVNKKYQKVKNDELVRE